MEFLKPAASPPSAWSAAHPSASSVCARRRAPFALGLLPHGPAADTATRTGTDSLLLTRAAGALGPISSIASPPWYSASKDMSPLHQLKDSAARTRSLAARLQVLLRPVAYPAAADARLQALENYRVPRWLLPLRALPGLEYPTAADARLPALETYRGHRRLLPLRAPPGSAYPATADARLPALEAYRDHPRLLPLRALPCSEYSAAAEERLPTLVTYGSRPQLPPLRALPGSSMPGRKRNRVAHILTHCTAEEGASSADKVKQSNRAKAEHILVFSVVCLVRYAEAEGMLTLISNKLKLPGKITAALVFLFVALKSVYNALKETKDIEEVLAYFRKIAKKGAPPTLDGAAKP